MKATVFRDEAIREQAGRFVWLEIDTDKPQNAAFREQFLIQALPTYLVVEPEREQVILRWVGGATVPEFLDVLDDAEANFRRARGDEAAASTGDAAGAGGTDPDALLAQADLLNGEGRSAEAAEKYRAALDAAPAGWNGYTRAVGSLLVNWSLEGSDAAGPAVELARRAYPHLSGTPSVAIVAGVGLDMAIQLPDDDPAKAEHVAFFEDAARRAAEDPAIAMAEDDRSGLYISLLSAREAAADSAGERSAATEWLSFLEAAAARAATPEARTVFDSHRLSACLLLEEPERALSMLQQSARDFPDDYNPPARLAVAYRELERWDEALAACDRAIALSYGPRQLRYLGTRAGLQEAMGDVAAARLTLEDALRQAEAMPEGQRSERTIESLRKKLDALKG
ncbi:thiol reductase thioredoxin [bacterium]|nr:thiol reductase thioredoxin [bacterium]